MIEPLNDDVSPRHDAAAAETGVPPAAGIPGPEASKDAAR